MTFIEALENETGRQMIETIEDIQISLEGKEGDQILRACYDSAIADFELFTGLKWVRAA